MKTLIILFLSILPWGDYSNFQSSISLNGKWTLIYFHDLTTDAKSFRPFNYPIGALTFTFLDNGSTGKLEGVTTANKVSGEYQLYESEIEVKRFGGTKIAENGWGGNFWQTISSSSSFKLEKDTLRIFFNNDSNIMVFANAEQKK